ncbi:MAG: aminotransferase class I/II-fold pyridoxal phosphate-dependent enzyme [Candidatus Lokiarchaeota archaeon]|nr:aminotransferase class I/II-fold pyridoxal phosphate-dependent enzyme [Candidatus Lokiarchaeota archaeon]
MAKFSSKLDKIKPTIFSEMTNLAIKFNAINLSQGFPDFDGPDFIKKSAIKAINEGKNQYCPSIGIPELRTAIADKYSKMYDINFDVNEEITIYSGATEAIFSTLFALLNPQDEVILFEPFYDAYEALCNFTGSIPRFVRIDPDYSIDFNQLKSVVNERTKCVIINNPHNPTGKVFNKEELEEICSICKDSFIITDEVYEHIIYEKKFVPISSLTKFRDRTVTISSTAKTFSLTGWKIGYTLASREISKKIRLVHQFVTFCTSTPLQFAMVDALKSDLSYYQNLKKDYWEKRDLLNSILQDAGFKTYIPEGSYYIVTDISRMGYSDDIKFCKDLITNIGVAAIPMSVFYSESNPIKHLVRFCFAKKNEVLEEAGKRLKKINR